MFTAVASRCPLRSPRRSSFMVSYGQQFRPVYPSRSAPAASRVRKENPRENFRTQIHRKFTLWSEDTVMSAITTFIKHHYRHFNAAALVDAAEGYNDHLAAGGKMFMTMAGAMSTAELGLSLAEMIRQDKVHGICCTGANLEEDIFNLVAHDLLRARAALPRSHARR